MENKKNIAPQTEQLKQEDLLKVQGGAANLREAPTEAPVEISDDTKNKV